MFLKWPKKIRSFRLEIQNVWKYRLKTFSRRVLIQMWDKWLKCFSEKKQVAIDPHCESKAVCAIFMANRLWRDTVWSATSCTGKCQTSKISCRLNIKWPRFKEPLCFLLCALLISLFWLLFYQGHVHITGNLKSYLVLPLRDNHWIELTFDVGV